MLGSAPRSLRTLVQLLLLAIVAGALYLYCPPIGAISPEALQHSLARAAGGSTSDERSCTNAHGDVWNCLVVDSQIGRAIPYELTRHGRRCWNATQTSPGHGHLDQSLSGCVGLRDQIRPEQRL